MIIKKFIEKAIEGGWVSKMKENATRKIKIEFNYTHTSFIIDNGVIRIPFLVAEVLLSPKFWQAVGKVEGWCEHDGQYHGCMEWCIKGTPICSRTRAIGMIDALWEGKTIEEFINTL